MKKRPFPRRCTANLAALLIGSAFTLGQPAAPPPADHALRTQWLTEETIRAETAIATDISTQADASGGCDGVKDGNWGFHTGNAANPWWEVDLGNAAPLARIVVWNRCDAQSAAERATNLLVRLSLDGKSWETVYGHHGAIFYGFTDSQPLEVAIPNCVARFVRLELPGEGFLHLDEVEVFGGDDRTLNLALARPADQVSTSTWSQNHLPAPAPDWRKRTGEVLSYCERLAREFRDAAADALAGRGITDANTSTSVAAEVHEIHARLKRAADSESLQQTFLEARALQRRLALANPLLDFETILFSKRVPPSFNHMSDQYYGWWSKPGGGIYLLRNFKTDAPVTECLTDSFREPGSFLRPTLSYDGRKILFAWCRFYPSLADETNKLDKANVPEDAFYHLFEMGIDGTDVRQLTEGKYDDFDGRYLPDGRVVFLSTRRGQWTQAGRKSAQQTIDRNDLPDCYVRCGGGPERPVAVYTLHTMNGDGSDLCAISPFEMFEWTPEIAGDGSILYSRWDYIDRDNMPYMGLWAISPDGRNPRIVYGNFSKAPHCAFEAKPVPNSHKIVFTASGHHSQTMGSLVLLDPSMGSEGAAPITRLTPEVPFPEIEGWPRTSYASPWPLSERFHLVAWGHEGLTVEGPEGWNRWHAVQRPANGMALYLLDAVGEKELIYADADISCIEPIPVRARPAPPILASQVDWDGPAEGRFLLVDVYNGLEGVKQGEIKGLRIVGVPPKTHPTMNYPSIGLTADDPGKCVFGTVPVEVDGSAYFRAPAGVTLFFQALDERGLTVQTMRSATHLQPGQTLSCIGCHEGRTQAPPSQLPLAFLQEPSRITVGPEGSWPVRFDQLLQPVLDRQCVACHSPDSTDKAAAKFDLSPAKAYDSLVEYGKPSLRDQVMDGYRRGYSVAGDGIARRSALWALIDKQGGHYEVALDTDDRERLITWMDTYAQKAGAFSPSQEAELRQMRRTHRPMLIERTQTQAAAYAPAD